MKVAVITAQGLGDGLQMMVAAHHLKINGHAVVVYNRYLADFHEFFKDFEFKYPFSIDEINLYDCILLEHDNSKLSDEIVNHLKDKIKPTLVIFTTNYSKEKHGPITQLMYCFDRKKTMIENIALGTKTMFSLKKITYDNGILIPENLTHRKNTKDIILHPTASHFDKTWDKKKFIQLAMLLKKKGFNPFFVMSSKERAEWLYLEELGIKIPLINSLANLAALLYESYAFIGNDSGPAHLASNLKLPVIVVGKNLRNLKYWQPFWHISKIIAPASYIPNLKFFRLRERKWRSWISAKKVFFELDQLLKK